MIIVGISDLAISNNPNDILVTYSLGSCVGVSLYDPICCVGGLIHCMLPTSKYDKETVVINPYMFVDTGLVVMLNRLYQLGAERSHLICKVAGAARRFSDESSFNIGGKNKAILDHILSKNNIAISAEMVGGTDARTMMLHMKNGVVKIKINGVDEVEL